jgi:hypothetical protein
LLARRELDDAFGWTASLCAASVVRLAKRPNDASRMRRPNGSLKKQIAFGRDEHQNKKVAGSAG